MIDNSVCFSCIECDWPLKRPVGPVWEVRHIADLPLLVPALRDGAARSRA